ncbi:MAG: GGDEF domain-containing protein [Colwellia sp.]|nr:MAG: GGDEF domain-containing protein [Colwellia sp.]
MIMLFNSHTVRNKFLLILMLIAVLSASVTAGVLIYYQSIDANKSQQDKLVLMSSVISPSLTAAIVFNDIDTINELIMPTVKTEGVFATYVYNNKGELITKIHRDNLYVKRLQVEDKIETSLVLGGEIQGTLIFYVDSSVVDDKMSFYRKLVAQLLIGTLFISLILSIILSRLITRPLSQLINIAKKVNQNNDYTIRAPYHSADEIGDLTNCFNAMLDTVENREHALESTVIERTKALEEANRQLHHQAHEDTLSGLPNRRSLYALLNANVDKKKKFCLLFIDLDGFKQINDSLGHDYGDILLQQVSRRIVSCVRADDFVARLGGDEFTIVLNGLTNEIHIDQIIHNILSSFEIAFSLKNKNIFASASIGVTLYPRDGNNVDTLIKNADQAMYESKRRGKNRSHYFTQEMSQQLINKKEKISDLHKALKNNEFTIYYQPIFNLKNNKVDKAEALIRWQHPTKGLILPDDFLGTIEEEGFMDELGYWVANQVLIDRLKWQQLMSAPMEVSINISPSQFRSKNSLLQKWLAEFETNSLPANAIAFEITEHSLVHDHYKVRTILNDIRNKGIRIAIDDFGVGYSSLSYLQQLNLDTLKIDRSFIDRLTSDNRSYGLCKGIVTIAQELNLMIVAEGIETRTQHKLVTELGCHYGQGYLYDKPMPREEFEHKYITQHLSTCKLEQIP